MLKISLLFSIAVIASRALAEQACPNVRLDKTSLKEVPIMEQDGVGLCWAYSATVLIDAYRFSHGDQNTKKFTSPLGLGIMAEDETNNKRAGTIERALQYAHDKGETCSHSQLSKRYRSSQFHVREWLDPPSHATYLRRWFDSPEHPELSCFASIFIDDFLGKETVNTVMMADSLEFAQVRGDVERICKANSIPVKVPAYKAFWSDEIPGYQGPASIVEFVKSKFAKPNPQPVGITFCADVLRDSDFRTDAKEGKHTACPNGTHAVAIVGSRVNEDGDCQFLIRNSWGKSCKPYDWDCERGQAWVDADALAPNVRTFEWLED